MSPEVSTFWAWILQEEVFRLKPSPGVSDKIVKTLGHLREKSMLEGIEMTNDTQGETSTKLEKLLGEAEQRLEELKGILPSEVSREKVSMSSKAALKAYAIHVGLLHRTADLAEGAIGLYKRRENLPAHVLTRSVLETAALFYYFGRKLEKAVESKKAKEAGDVLMRIMSGARNTEEEIKAVSILTAVDKLDKDARGVRAMYDELCEVAHPNSMGTVGHYGESDKLPHTPYFDKEHEGLPPEAAVAVVSALLLGCYESNDAFQDALLQFKTLHEQEYDGD
jgi:hypothetical protein